MYLDFSNIVKRFFVRISERSGTKEINVKVLTYN